MRAYVRPRRHVRACVLLVVMCDERTKRDAAAAVDSDGGDSDVEDGCSAAELFSNGNGLTYK